MELKNIPGSVGWTGRYVIVIETDRERRATAVERLRSLGLIPVVSPSLAQGMQAARRLGLRLGPRSVVRVLDDDHVWELEELIGLIG